MRFFSRLEKKGSVSLPSQSGIRIMMMPVILGDLNSVPDFLNHYRESLCQLFSIQDHDGRVGYLTIDERSLAVGETHRRPGLHVDGIYKGSSGGWGGGGGGWGGGYHNSTGMLCVSSIEGCRAWNQEFIGNIGSEGECDHLADQCGKAVVLRPGMAYWMDGLCVHESMPMSRTVDRIFVRLSLPSDAPWFEGYTENPKGVLPTGPILSRRTFMDM